MDKRSRDQDTSTEVLGAEKEGRRNSKARELGDKDRKGTSC